MRRWLAAAVLVLLIALQLAAVEPPASFMRGTAANRPAAGAHLNGAWYWFTDAGAGRWSYCDGAAWYDCSYGGGYSGGGGALPAGIIVMWSGTIANIPSGWALCDGANGTPDLRSSFVKSVGAAEDPGATGGAATHAHANHSYTPAGTVSTPTFAGDALATHAHGAGTYAASAHAGTAVADHAAHTHAFGTIAVADHASHTHTYTDIVNHTHPVTDPGHAHTLRHFPTATGGSTGYTVDTSMSGTQTNNSLSSASATTGITTANPAGGVATGTTAGPSATLTHGVSGSTGNPSAPLTHGVTQPDAHTMSGSSASVSGGTPSGTVSTPTFSGTPASPTHDSVNHEPVYYKVAFIMKLA